MAGYVDKIKQRLQSKTTESKEQSRREWQEFYDHPLLFTALIVSGFLSAMAGLSIGLGLQVKNGEVNFYLDFPHVFFALLYAVLFPYFFEFGLGSWSHKYLHREPENRNQQITAAIMSGVTFIGTAITAFAAMDVLVTSLGFFASFQEIPVTVQRWIAFSLPAMLMLNVIAGEIYRQSSEAAILRREAEKDLREARISADVEVKLAQMEADKNIAIRAAQEYATRAGQDTQRLGAQKGSQQWEKDKQRHEVPMQPVYNSSVNQVKPPDNGTDPMGRPKPQQ